MKIRVKKGQSTLEYLIIVVVIIALLITIATTVFKPNISSLLNRVTRKPAAMVDSVNMIPNP